MNSLVAEGGSCVSLEKSLQYDLTNNFVMSNHLQTVQKCLKYRVVRKQHSTMRKPPSALGVDRDLETYDIHQLAVYTCAFCSSDDVLVLAPLAVRGW